MGSPRIPAVWEYTEPSLFPEWRGAPKHSKSPRSRTRKKTKGTKQLARTVSLMQPLRASSSPLPLGGLVRTCWTLPMPSSSREPSPDGAGQGGKAGRTPEVTAHAACTAAAQQEAWRLSISPAGLQGALINPEPGSWSYHSPVLKVAPDGRRENPPQLPRGFPTSLLYR